jgi:hypothetical protein
MDSYVYKPLNSSPKQPMIRLLELLPGPASQTIECRFNPVPLLSKRYYEALSYCWGDPVVTTKIICDGLRLSVTMNLHQALYRLRSESSQRTLWVDAICINQGDNNEKNEQVAQMREIYRLSQQVVIWLGEEDHHSQLALSIVPALARSYSENLSPRRPTETLVSRTREKWGKLPSSSDERWHGLMMLLQRPWFQRIWVVQEVAVSPDAIVVCGGDVVSWDDFACAVVHSSDLQISTIYGDDSTIERVMIMVTIRHNIQDNTPYRIVPLLKMLRTCLATNPLDKIFAICGLAADVGRNGINIPIDYSLNPSELYRKFAVAVLKRDCNLDLLQLPRASHFSRLSDLPSWVPDWSITGEYIPLNAFDLDMNSDKPGLFEATRGTKFVMNGDEKTNILVVEGMIVDSIIKTGDFIAPPSNPKLFVNIPQQLKALLKGLNDLASLLHTWEDTARFHTNCIYATGEDIKAVYIQTLLRMDLAGEREKEEENTMRFHKFNFTPRLIRFTNFLQFHRLHWILYSLILVVLFAAAYFLGLVHVERGSDWVAPDRKMARTSTGLLAMAPGLSGVGDKITLFKGGKTPFVIRAKGSHWELIGEAYVHGIMYGGAFNEEKCKNFQLV